MPKIAKKSPGTKSKSKSKEPEKPEPFTHDGRPIAMDDATVLHVFGLGRDIGVIAVTRFKEKMSLDLRRFYPSDENDWQPTAKGMRIPADTVEEVLDALAEQRERISELIK